MSKASVQSQALRVTVVGMVLDLFLGLTKLTGGALTQSFALIVDGIHSLSDAITDIFVLVITQTADPHAKGKHPHRHSRLETMGMVAIGMLIFTIAGILLYDSIMRLQKINTLPVPAAAGLIIALVSVASKEWIYRYTMSVATRIDSSLLKANAWHSRTDAISSVVVLVGLLAARQGYTWMDTVAAFIVTLIIARMGWGLCMDSLRELIETTIPIQRRRQIENTILGVKGILSISSLQSLPSGGRIILVLQLVVEPRITVSEGHQLGEIVSHTLTGNFSEIAEVSVQIEPEDTDDEHAGRSVHPSHFPPRQVMIDAIRSSCAGLVNSEDIDSIILHYLEQGIEAEVTLTQSGVSAVDTAALEAALGQVEHIVSIKILGKLAEVSLIRHQ